MTQAQFLKMVSEIDPAVLAGLVGKPKAEKTSKAQMLANKDKTLRATFTKRGYSETVLMDRTDPTKPFNVRPYKGWLTVGRVVKKGEKNVKGLFHEDQTREMTADEIAKLQG